jgi:hypothetical protein
MIAINADSAFTNAHRAARGMDRPAVFFETILNV